MWGEALNLREAARGKPCFVRLPGVCNGKPETTVLAHLPIAGTSGMGLKAVDLCATWACSSCHDVIDGRAPHPGDCTREYIKACADDGMKRTITYLVQNGTFSTSRTGTLLWHQTKGIR